MQSDAHPSAYPYSSSSRSSLTRTSLDKPLPNPPPFSQRAQPGSSPDVAGYQDTAQPSFQRQGRHSQEQHGRLPIAAQFERPPESPPTQNSRRSLEQRNYSRPVSPDVASVPQYPPARQNVFSDSRAKARDTAVHPIPLDESQIRTRTADTDVQTTWNRPVVHETIQPIEHEERQEIITREIHNHHVIHRILPVRDVEVLPAKHYAPIGPNGALVEIPPPEGELPGQSHAWTIVANPISTQHGENPYPWTREVFKKGERETVGEDGVRRTETTWIHPAHLEEGAMITGQSAQFDFGRPRRGDSDSTFVTAVDHVKDKGHRTAIDMLVDQSRYNREAEEVVRMAQAMSMSESPENPSQAPMKKKAFTPPTIPERKPPNGSGVAAHTSANYGRPRVTSSGDRAVPPQSAVQSPYDYPRDPAPSPVDYSPAAAAASRAAASMRPSRKSVERQPRSSQDVIDAAIVSASAADAFRTRGP